MAALHRVAFKSERPWSAEEFQKLIENKFVHVNAHAQGFALSRSIADESELLTIAVHPDHQGMGIGRTLLRGWISGLLPSVRSCFLEVAADNLAALHLYTSEQFAEIARRPAYYARRNAPSADAIVLRRTLTHGHGTESAAAAPESG